MSVESGPGAEQKSDSGPLTEDVRLLTSDLLDQLPKTMGKGQRRFWPLAEKRLINSDGARRKGVSAILLLTRRRRCVQSSAARMIRGRLELKSGWQ